jgi:hypothetical protein
VGKAETCDITGLLDIGDEMGPAVSGNAVETGTEVMGVTGLLVTGVLLLGAKVRGVFEGISEVGWLEGELLLLKK